jgi:anti-sigma factor RsiW
MTERPIQPDDFELLISRALDGDLSPAEQQRLEAALAASPALRRQAAQYTALAGLLERFAAAEAPTAQRSIEADVLAGLRLAADEDSDAGALEGVDRLLDRYALARPEVDGDAFAASVMRQIVMPSAGAERFDGASRNRRLRWFVGVPLAAAAALALAVTLPWSTRDDSRTITVVENRETSPDGAVTTTMVHKTEETTPIPDEPVVAPAPAVVRVADVSLGRPTGVSEVSFGREPAPGWTPPTRSAGIGYAAVSFAAPRRGGDGLPF